MQLVNYCANFAEIVSSGTFHSKRCGQVFAVNEVDFRFAWTTKVNHRGSFNTGKVVFVGQAAALFHQHRVEGPWTGAKWIFGQYTTAGGHLEWDPLPAVDGVLTVSRARLVPGKGLALWKLWFQRLLCDGWGGLVFLPFYFATMLGGDPPLVLQSLGAGFTVPIELLGVLALAYPLNRVGMIRRPSWSRP